MTSHFPDHAFLSSTAVGIMRDQIFVDYGSADDVITEDNLRQAYGMDVKVVLIEEANRKVWVPLKNLCQILLMHMCVRYDLRIEAASLEQRYIVPVNVLNLYRVLVKSISYC